jgi:hypothetical protein
MEIGDLRPSELQDLLEGRGAWPSGVSPCRTTTTAWPGSVSPCRTTAAAWPGSVSPCRVVVADRSDVVSRCRVIDADERGANLCRTMPNSCRVLPA